MSHEKPHTEKYIRTTVSLPPWVYQAAKKEANLKAGGKLSTFVATMLENYFNTSKPFDKHYS